jgi:hypothetical protein
MTPCSWSLIAAACVVVACADDRPFVPSVAVGDPTQGGSERNDAGSKSDDDEDAGKPDAGGPPLAYCTRVRNPIGASEDNPDATYVEMPSDLVLTRQVESWSHDCSKLRLILEFSDGACPVGLGHSLTFSFGYQDFLDGALHGGNNMIGSDAETPTISVRYTRPKDLTPNGTWGTCEGAEGQLIFAEAPVPQPGNYLQARFQLSLTACDGTKSAPQFLDGAFRLLQRTAATEACP